MVLLAIFIAGPDFGAIERLAAIGPQLGLLVFIVIWLLAVAAIVHIAFFGSPLAKLAWTLVLVPGMLIAHGYRAVTAGYFGYLEAIQLSGLLGFAGEAFAFHGRQLVGALALALVGVVAINLDVKSWPGLSAAKAPGSAASRLGRWGARVLPGAGSRARHMATRAAAPALHFAPLALLVAILFVRGGEGTNGLPGHYTSAAFAVTMLAEKLARADETHDRKVGIALGHPAAFQDIVVVMDESVRGDLLDLNNPGSGVASGLPGRPETVNFGVASSIANCSTASNHAFRFAASSDHYLQDLREHPSLWKYARNAGFRTVYLDGQRSDGRLQNRMDQRELAYIDQHIQLPADTPPEQRDIKLARRLRALLAKHPDTAQFIYVNKMGVHFPYEGKYPASQASRTPTMQRRYFGTDIDPDGIGIAALADNDGASGGAQALFKLRMKNSYLNAVAWNTGGFFSTLLDGLDLADTLLVYTSDHGQDLHQDDRPGHATHCTLGPSIATQGKVPLVLLTGDPFEQARLRGHAARNFDRASQFNLIPSLLAWMGYDRNAIAASQEFNAPLSARLDGSDQRFLSTFYVRLGRSPYWNPIHPQPDRSPVTQGGAVATNHPARATSAHASPTRGDSLHAVTGRNPPASATPPARSAHQARQGR